VKRLISRSGLAWILIGLLVGMVACDSSEAPSLAGSPTPGTTSLVPITPAIPPPFDQENANQLTDSDVQIILRTNKAIYPVGEMVLVTALVRNLSSVHVNYRLSNQGDPTPYVWLADSPYFRGFGLEEKALLGGVRTVMPMERTGTLGPHEIVTREVVWDQKFWRVNGVQAPQGTYTIGCGMTLGDPYGDRTLLKSLSLTLNISIVGAPGWITPEQAKSIAFSLPEVIAWREQHSGKNVMKEENGVFFVLFPFGWEKVSPSASIEGLTLSEFREWVPDATVGLIDGAWLVQMATKLGPEPHRLTVRVNPETGAVQNIQVYAK